MKMSRLSPRIKALQKKYENDQQKQSEAIQAVYKEENVSMGSGCLWSLLPLLFLFPLYAVVRQPIVYMLGETADVAAKIVEVIKAANPGAFTGGNYYDQMFAAPLIPTFAHQLKEVLPDLSASTLEGIDFTFLGINLGVNPQWNFFAEGWKWDWNHIGGALLPVLSAAGQFLSIMISQKMNASVVTNEKGLQDKDTANNTEQAQTGKMMMWVGPIMSLLIGYSIPGALSLYWFVQGLVSTGSDVYLTAKYRKIYDEEDAKRLEKYLAEEAEEEEKERQRAKRREENPDGITANTSKKKQQQNKQKAQEAERAAAAKEYEARKGNAPQEETPEKTVMSGIPARPYCKGRNYDPNRYQNTDSEE
jgi:YidC/Oxa1 family membrane protein insertase